jgi:nitrogen-specific signal transduction histidine kinase
LVSDFVEVIESSVGSSVDLELVLRRRLPKVMVDPEQLEMALLNIIINSRMQCPRAGS